MSEVYQEDYRAAAAVLQKFGQSHVLRFWGTLSNWSRQQMLAQIRSIDFDLMARMATEYIKTNANELNARELKPAPVISIAHQRQSPKDVSERRMDGEKFLRSGRLAALLVAGGQGSRLGFEGPKGALPIGPVSNKPLFQLHAEKLLAGARRYGVALPWYIMTSETNDAETKDFFQSHNFFGLRQQDVFFFKQGEMPALDAGGKLILDAPDHIFMNPDGHGGTLRALQKSGALKDMQRRGIEEIFYFQVDNVLLNMCDPLFIGYHLHAEAEMSAKVCAKRDAAEKMGLMGMIDGRMAVIEYSDMRDEDKKALLPDGTLKYKYGNLAIHLLKRSFIERELGDSEGNKSSGRLPWHLAHKRIPYIDDGGNLVNPSQPNGYKFETFIFDALGDARRVVCMEVDRRDEFSGVKNAEGEDSPATAKAAMTEVYARWLEAAGVSVPRAGGNVMSRIEISPLYALDAAELAAKVPADLQIGDVLYLE
jgi:UDP-N-acetylglucosamine/UDP-N-acetylgalactosamine diphosphorylase